MIAAWYAIVSFMLIIYVALGRAQFWRWNASLACRQDARGTPSGGCRDRTSLVMA